MVLKRCLRQLVLPKGKIGQLPFVVTREWNLNIVYGLYYGKDFFFYGDCLAYNISKKNPVIWTRD